MFIITMIIFQYKTKWKPEREVRSQVAVHKLTMICSLDRWRWQERWSGEQVLSQFAKQKSEKLLAEGGGEGGWTALGPPVDMPLDTNFTKILPVVHIFTITIMSSLKILIGIKSSNTKQCPARLSLHPVKLSSFIGGKSQKKRRQ